MTFVVPPSGGFKPEDRLKAELRTVVKALLEYTLVPTLRVGTRFLATLRVVDRRLQESASSSGRKDRDAERRLKCVPTRSVGTRVVNGH